jgi:DNA-directed RNA polymerase specialized sigma24 family protein
MVRPLKKCKEDGIAYTRPPKIEGILIEVLAANATTWPDRARITNKQDAQFLPPEVLVHLIRHSLRMQDHGTMYALLPRLGERCAQLLKRRVSDTNLFDAADLREEMVASLYGLFVDDLWNPEDGVLDYFEIHFNHAFATLRAGIIRKTLAASAPLDSLDEPADEDEAPAELADLSPDTDIVLSAENEELHRLIQALPFAEQQAIVWKYFYGLKTESTDPAERTVASVCGVSGSEIRARLRSAYARLKNRMEE